MIMISDILNPKRLSRLWPRARWHKAVVVFVLCTLSILGFFNSTPNVVMPGGEPFQCNDIQHTAASAHRNHVVTGKEKLIFAVAPPGLGIVLEGWPHTPTISVGERAPVITFKGIASKRPNGPILSTGSALLFNCDVEYRVVWMKVWLNHTDLRGGEAVESDVCLNIFDQSKTTSMSSGEEIFCTHEHFFNGDQSHDQPTEFQFPGGGFPVRNGQRVDISSVSKIYNREEWSAMPPETVAKRLTPGLLALSFKVKFVRADLIHRRGLRSTRSPLRDRSFFVVPQRESTPTTPFINAKEAVRVLGIGIFQSMLVHYMAGDSLVRILVDDTVVHRRCLLSHQPHVATSPLQDIIATNITLATNSSISVVHSLHEDSGASPVYDFAAYIFYEVTSDNHDSYGHGGGDGRDGGGSEGGGGGGVDDDSLIPYQEIHLGHGALDLNGDTYADYVDYDVDGHIWSEMSLGPGVHDTQHVTIYDFRTRTGRFNRSSTVWNWFREEECGLMSVKLTDATTGLCCYLRAVSKTAHAFEYCDSSKLFVKQEYDATVHGDFDGDGFLDLIRLRPTLGGIFQKYQISLARGDGKSFLPEKHVTSVRGCKAATHASADLMPLYKSSLGRHQLVYILPKCSHEWMWKEYL